MRYIRFGTYSLKIKSYSAKEIGLNQEYSNMSFSILQKVFHFWYIPLFPVEKFWKIKDDFTGEPITDTTPKIRSAIDLKLLKQRTPIWSYIGLIIIIIPMLCLLTYLLYGAVSEGIDGVNKNIAKNNRIDLKVELVKTPQINDLYTFRTLNVDMVTDMNGHFIKYKASYFSSPSKVDYIINYISRDSIGFEFLEEEKSNDYTYGLKKEFRLSKNDLILAAKNYQELKVYKYPKKPDSNTKDVLGIFKINREEEAAGN